MDPPSYSPQQHPNYPPQQPYASQQLYPQPQQQQQQQQVVIVNAGQQQQVVGGSVRPYQSFCAHICLACCVTWCCGGVFGCVAFILAMIASDRAGAGQENEARCMGRASIGVSVAGILITVVVVSIIVGVIYSNIKAGATKPSDCYRSCRASYSGPVEYRRCNLCI